jgi:hypothetical protein
LGVAELVGAGGFEGAIEVTQGPAVKAISPRACHRYRLWK